jgi:hypothetical protein
MAHDLAAQIGSRGEDPSGDEVALDLGEPDFDLIEPRAKSQASTALVFMGREVVTDDVHLPVIGLGHHHPIEEREKRLAGVALGGHALDVTGVNFQRGIEMRVVTRWVTLL